MILVNIPKINRMNGSGHLLIDELWENPHFRKRGVANALMKKVDLRLRLYVNTTNVVGVSFYKNAAIRINMVQHYSWKKSGIYNISNQSQFY